MRRQYVTPNVNMKESPTDGIEINVKIGYK